MRLVCAELAWEDYLYRQKQDSKLIERINKLIEATALDPYAGEGKPEPLKQRSLFFGRAASMKSIAWFIAWKAISFKWCD